MGVMKRTGQMRPGYSRRKLKAHHEGNGGSLYHHLKGDRRTKRKAGRHASKLPNPEPRTWWADHG